MIAAAFNEEFFAGNGEMAALMRAHDWASTALGPVSEWPQSLKITVNICLNSRFPTVIWWGPDLVMLYNDAYRSILGESRHPHALGSPGRAIWPEIWPVIGPMLEGVLADGTATGADDQLLLLERNGHPEETYFTYSHSPVQEEKGQVAGVFTTIQETTQRVIRERRLRTVQNLGELLKADTVTEVSQLAMAALSENPADIPFALLYLLDSATTQAILAASTGLVAGTTLAPLLVELRAEQNPFGQWPLAEAARSGKPIVLSNVNATFGTLPGGPWSDSPNEVLILPITTADTGNAVALLVAGVSPARLLDDEYHHFFEQITGAIGTTLTKVCAYEEERKRAEAQWQTLFNEAPLGIYVVDDDFRIRAINPTARPVFGEIPNLIGRDFEEVIRILWAGEYVEEIVRRFRHTLETGEPYRTPERMEERQDGSGTEHYEWRLNRIPLPGGRNGVVCYFRDISAQVLAWKAIAESQEERRRTAEGLRAIAARARCLLWYAEVEDQGDPDLQWTLRVADEEAARRFLPIVMPLGHSYGRALSEARLPEDRTRMAWGDDEIRAGRSYRQEFRVRDVWGHIRWLGEDVQIETMGPNRWYAVGICIDITERKRAEEEREKHLAEIETLNNRLQRAMTETHHRVKNNLQLISAMIDMQRNANEEMVPVSEFARLSANVRALSVIHDILTKEAKAGSGQETLSVKAVLEELLQGVRQTIGERVLEATIEDTLLVGRQTTTLALVTNELIANALKHGRGKIKINFRVRGDHATLEACDDGPGFPEDFNPVTAANTGLELIENIVQWDLHGQTAYDNRAEGGARITVTFPLATPK